MNPNFATALRKTIALQVAILEFENSDITDTQALGAMKECLKELTKSVKELEKLL